MQQTDIRISELDSARFGIRVARTVLLDTGSLDAALRYCRSEAVNMLVARCASGSLHLVQAAERQGFLLMDTLVYYSRKLEMLPGDAVTRAPLRLPGGLRIRPATPQDGPAVKLLAQESFRGYQGHYHADPRLDTALCNEGYADWAWRSCVEPDVADAVLVGEIGADIAAFATLTCDRALQSGEGVLFGVAPEFQGRGIYQAMMREAMAWCAGKDCLRIDVSTQVTNIAVQKAWVRLGFEPAASWYTLHKWF